MTSRTTLRFAEGTKQVGTATVREDREIRPDYASRQLQKLTGVPPNNTFDDFIETQPAAKSLAPRARKSAVLGGAPEPRSVSFTVGGVPVAKGRPRAFKSATGIGMHTPKKTKVYETTVQAAAGRAMDRSIPFGRPVSVSLAIWLPIPKSWSKRRKTEALLGNIAATNKPDADNVLKALKDGMNGIVYEDDAQVVEIVCAKRYSDLPRVDVVVKELNKEAA